MKSGSVPIPDKDYSAEPHRARFGKRVIPIRSDRNGNRERQAAPLASLRLTILPRTDYAKYHWRLNNTEARGSVSLTLTPASSGYFPFSIKALACACHWSRTIRPAYRLPNTSFSMREISPSSQEAICR